MTTVEVFTPAVAHVLLVSAPILILLAVSAYAGRWVLARIRGTDASVDGMSLAATCLRVGILVAVADGYVLLVAAVLAPFWARRTWRVLFYRGTVCYCVPGRQSRHAARAWPTARLTATPVDDQPGRGPANTSWTGP